MAFTLTEVEVLFFITLKLVCGMPLTTTMLTSTNELERIAEKVRKK